MNKLALILLFAIYYKNKHNITLIIIIFYTQLCMNVLPDNIWLKFVERINIR